MTSTTIIAYVVAIAFVLLAIAMAFTAATNLELAGFWLLAAFLFGLANFCKSLEKSIPRSTRPY